MRRTTSALVLLLLLGGCVLAAGCQESGTVGATSTSVSENSVDTLGDGSPAPKDMKPTSIDAALVGTWYSEDSYDLVFFCADGTTNEGMLWDTASSAEGPLVRLGSEGYLTPYRYTLEGDTLMMPDPRWGGPDGPVLTFHRTELRGDDRLLGSWSFRTDGAECYLGFRTDGIVEVGSMSTVPGEPEGNAIQGYWRTDGKSLWFLNGGEWIKLRYTVKGKTLRMPSPDDPEGSVHTYRWDGPLD